MPVSTWPTISTTRAGNFPALNFIKAPSFQDDWANYAVKTGIDVTHSPGAPPIFHRSFVEL
jgi:hypothetical protein